MATDIQPLVSKALADLGQGASRRERVFAVAKIWHRHNGTLPTIDLARNLSGGRGSLTDVSRDLKDFAATVAVKTERLINTPDMPEDLGIQINDLVNQLWLAATTKAAGEFNIERAELQAHNDELGSKNKNLEAERLQALTDRSAALEQLAAEQRNVASLKEIARTLENTVSDLKATIGQLQARIGEMETDKLRTAREHDAAVTGLKSQALDRDNRILDLQNAAATIKAGYEEKVAAAMTLESEHRIRANQAEQGRQTAQAALEVASNELATIKGQQQAMNSRIQDLEQGRDAAVGQVAVLTHSLETERAGRQEVVALNIKLKTEVQEKSGLIQTLQGRVADLETKAFKEKR
ncbi:MAG: DNA-binding protein [Sterolibacterium sp.]